MNQGFMNQRKTTFNEKFDKAIKFYDFAYHVQKSTYKGLSSFYKRYSDIERYYADSLINLTKEAWTEIPELSKQNAALVSTVKQIINCMQTTSQLHFNYAERLVEVSSAYNSEYFSAKRKKDNMMKILKDKNQDEYNALRQRQKTNRASWNAKQKDICRVLYQNLNKLAEQENERVHKVKEQTIIYFTLYKKVCQKQLQATSQYNLKLVKQQIQVKNPRIAEIAQQLRSQFNEYGGEQIQRRSYDINSNPSMIFNRESLRQSMLFKQKISRVNQTQNQLKKMVEQYQMAPDNLLLITYSDAAVGLFDPNQFGKDERRKYSRQMNSHIVKNIVYDMFEGYWKVSNPTSDQLMLLQLMKTNLRIKSTIPKLPNYSCADINAFWNQVRSQVSDQQYLFHVRILQEVSKISNASYSNLQNIIRKKQRKQLQSSDILFDGNLNFISKTAIIDILLQAICIGTSNQPILTQDFNDYLHLIANFGQNFFGLDRSVSVLLLLRKIDRFFQSKDTQQQIELMLTDNYFVENTKKLSESKTKILTQTQNQCKSSWCSNLMNNATQKLCHFYRIKSSFLNYVKILLVIQKLGLNRSANFSARDHFYRCIRCAGFNYLKSTQTSRKIFDSDSISGEDRLKNIVEGIQQLDYDGIVVQYLNPAATQISKLLGVGDKIVRNKLFEQFTYPIYDFINGNLNLLSQQEGVDRDGYVLRLGIILAKLDIANPQPITQYDTFFKVLKTYLQATEKDYDNMLQHSRKTQLWIMQQNALATPNCIDFCSLLYKPFEFLLISLKQLQKSKKTQYTKRYSQFIKLRLNTVLKNQIIKYINFLYESLANYRNTAPELTLKPRRLQKPHILTKQQMQKERLGFKELTRRLFNLLFLKDQLEQMICDFLDPDVYKRLDNSIFNLDKLNKLAAQSPQYRDILTNIKQIVQAVLFNQEKIVNRIADNTVFHFMTKIFDNLYFQLDKNAIQQFFSNASDYKLSEHTFLKYQQVMEDWFMMISKNIPDPFSKTFARQFSKAFYQAIQFQVLNSTKFKLPFKQANVIPYLDSDVAFVTTMMKQKFFDQNVIGRQIKAPFKDLLIDLQTQTSKYAGLFEAATLKNDKQKCKYILVLLNLRVKDEKAMEFVKKYKTIVTN